MDDFLSPTYWKDDQPLIKTFLDKDANELYIVLHATWVVGYRIWVYKSRKERVGVCNCSFEGIAAIDTIRINKEYRGSGLGRELLNLAVQEAKRRGHTALYLVVSSYDLEDTPFLFDWYRRNGFAKSDDLWTEGHQTLLKKSCDSSLLQNQHHKTAICLSTLSRDIGNMLPI